MNTARHRGVKSTDPAARLGAKPPVPWGAVHFVQVTCTSLCLRFFIFRMGITSVSVSQGCCKACVLLYIKCFVQIKRILIELTN